MGALSRLTDRMEAWRRRRAAFRELEEIGAEGRNAVCRDVGVDAPALARLVARGPDSAAGLPRLMRTLGLDLERLARVDPALARDMKVACAECRSLARCGRDLEAGTARLSHKAYCPNAATLAALSAQIAEDGAVSKRAERPVSGPPPAAEASEPPWGFSKELDRPARAWPMAKRVERQARLMGAMMERVGVDPGAAAREARGIAFAAASRRCLICSNSELCERWLAGGSRGAPPAFCPNAAFLNRVRTAARGSPSDGEGGNRAAVSIRPKRG